MKRLLPLLLSLCLLLPLLPAAAAEDPEPQPLTALCVTAPGQPAYLDMKEFQLLCQQATGRDLESVAFDSLSPAVGTLTFKGEKITPGDPYYAYRSPQLSQILFTPYTYLSRHFSGQGELPFTMTDERGQELPGILVLHVPQDPEDPAPTPLSEVTIRADGGTPVSLTAPLPTSLYYKVNRRPSQGSYYHGNDGYYAEGAIDSLTFTLPPSSQGYLWLDYEYPSARKVLPGEVLYSDREPNCYSVTFVPSHTKGDTVHLSYLATSGSRTDLPGSVTITLVDKTPSKPSTPSPKPDPEPPLPQFRDLEGYGWAVPSIHFLAQQGYEFMSPGDHATRMEVIHALVRAAGYPNGKGGASSFSDLPDDAFLLLVVDTAVEHGLVQGDGTGRLLPEAPVTRQDALCMIHRALTGKGLPSLPGDLSAFSDAADLAPYAREAAETLYARGVLLGNEAGKLDPLSPITRAEMACLLHRAFG